MSSKETKHIQHAIKQSSVAGTIASGNTNTTNMQGIQFTGRFYQPEEAELVDAKKGYLKRFPMALLFNSLLWTIETESIKMTDNTLGFGIFFYGVESELNKQLKRLIIIAIN